MRRTIVVTAIMLASITAGHAADFSKASCDSPAFKSFMLARLGHGKSVATGKLMANRFDFGPITAATMVSNTGDSISCEISVDLSTNGGVRLVHGRFTAKGKGWNWQPAY